MAFHDVRFPEAIGRGARGGPQRRTDIVTLASGAEERNARWSQSLRRYDVGYGIRRSDDLDLVLKFWEARLGQLYGFRFKDWLDYKSCAPSGTPGASDQSLGTGTGTARKFQLRKWYSSGGFGVWRSIRRPVAGTVLVALDGVVQASGWTVDTATGVVTFTTAPGSGVAVTAGFEFDVPVRFDSDTLDVTLDIETKGTITSIPLVEIREADASLA